MNYNNYPVCVNSLQHMHPNADQVVRLFVRTDDGRNVAGTGFAAVPLPAKWH